MIFASLALFAQITIRAVAPDTVALSQPLAIVVEVISPNQRPPEVIAPDFRGFALRRTAVATRIVGNSASPQASLEYRYELVTTVPGEYTIDPFEARLDNMRARSNAIKVVVRGPDSFRVPAVVFRARLDSTRPVNVSAIGAPDTVYVGEQATYQVAVFVEESAMRRQIRRNPTFNPPDMRGTLAYEMPPTRAVLPVREAGRFRYQPNVYQRAIFPLVPGRHVVPAATLNYTLPVSSSFFSREENYSLRTDSVVIVALPLPSSGQPDDFTGAVGSYTVEHSVSTRRPRLGDPFVLTLRIKGEGNIKLLPRPALDIPWGRVIPANEKVSDFVSADRVQGQKEFEWVVTPLTAGVKQLDAIEYSYFNPDSRRYQRARTRPDTIEVLPGSLVAENELAQDSVAPLPLRREFAGERGGLPHQSTVFLLALLAAPLPALAAAVRRVPRRRRRPTTSRAALATLAEHDERDAAAVRRALLSALQARLALPHGVAADADSFRRELLRRGVSRTTAAEAAALLAELNAVVFGAATGITVSAARARQLYERIAAEAIAVPAGRPSAAGRALLVLAFSVPLLSVQSASELFSRGVQLYDERAYDASSRLFADLATQYKRSPDVWANRGAAAWQNGDTAVAVQAWQRAARLQPHASDLRRYLLLTGKVTVGDERWIPPVPPGPLELFALLAWMSFWGILYLRLGRVRDVPSGWIAWSAIVAIASAAGAGEVVRRTDGRSLAVVSETVLSHTLPVLGSTPVSRLNSGELVRVVRKDGDWLLVSLASESDGWVHSSFLLPVSID